MLFQFATYTSSETCNGFINNYVTGKPYNMNNVMYNCLNTDVISVFSKNYSDFCLSNLNEGIESKGGNLTNVLSLPETHLEGNHEITDAEFINILSLNVCGLESKLCCPEFIDCLNNHCIIGLQETKCDNLDYIDIMMIFVQNIMSK